MDFEQIRARLAALDTAHLADANKRIRVVDPAIRPMVAGARLIGRARTVRCHEDFLAVIKALADATPGDVLVVDTQDSRAAVAGEIFTTEAQRRGLAGIVIDGACRDVAAIRRLGLPVYARAVIPVAGTVVALGTTGETIRCGNVEVRPGDIICGDDDGLIVASVDELETLIPAAEAIRATEERILERLHGGESLLAMTNFAEHYANVLADRDSALRFLP